MGLFLSKFLPALLYPLGLITLLVSFCLYLAWKQRNILQIPLIFLLLILIFGGNSWVGETLLFSLESQTSSPSPVPQAEAIVILGGSTFSATPPRPMVEINGAGDRVLYGAKLYREGKAPLIIATGGRISWLSSGDPESQDMANLLNFLGVPNQAIIQDPLAINTRENAINVKKILEKQGIKKILLVTSAYHMRRAQRIFEKLDIAVIPAPTDFQIAQDNNAQFDLQTVILNLIPDVDAMATVTLVIKEYLGLIMTYFS